MLTTTTKKEIFCFIYPIIPKAAFGHFNIEEPSVIKINMSYSKIFTICSLIYVICYKYSQYKPGLSKLNKLNNQIINQRIFRFALRRYRLYLGISSIRKVESHSFKWCYQCSNLCVFWLVFICFSIWVPISFRWN